MRSGLGRPPHPAALESGDTLIPVPKGNILTSIPATYNRAHHAFAVFTACATLVVITAGALVTSNDAGLSVPDWPTSFGYLVKVPHFVGGVRYEWSHRMVAGSLIFLTLSIAVWTLLVERRRWLRWLAMGAVCTVIAQATLGGLTVLFFQPPWLSTAHATVAQTFFCIAVAIALFTGRNWVRDQPEKEQPHVEFDSRRPSLFTLTLLSIFVLYVQLILGGMFRHHGMSWWPHVLHAVIVSVVLAWTAIRAISVYSNIEAVRRPAIVMLSLLIMQLCLGFTAFLTRVAWGRSAAQPELPMVAATVAHVAVGALLLATTVVLAIQVWRHVPAAFAERVPHPQRDASAA
ncbi:MAG TPA: COX15/CtaA family protein [Candidatus Acidoferrum sp.]|nr:COX15/CtaA family protein [Candidatus Acidoferrum sp.]